MVLAISASRSSKIELIRQRPLGMTTDKSMTTFSRFVLVFLLFLLSCDAIGQSVGGGVTVEISSLRPLQLHITLRSGADKQVEIYRSQLPWATRYSMVVAVVRPSGECLEKILAIEDPPVGKISVEPKQALTGELNLEKIFKGVEQARKKSDIHLFWAYQSPSELGIARWLGGWILIPQDRTP